MSMGIRVFSPDYLDTLLAEAVASPRRRQHRNVHVAFDDPCQRLFNAIGIDSYLRPHRHALPPKAETMIAVRGLMALMVFDDAGQVVQSVRFGAGHHAESPGVAIGVETPPGHWHTVLALEPGSVLLEIKAGPFDPSAPKELAPWAPEEESADAVAYFTNLRAVAAR